jgi:MtN3 and saliva related transmembrane protein
MVTWEHDMPNWLPIVVGMIAGICSTFAFVPQVLKIWREGDTHAISLRMYLMRVTGFVLWLWYGFVIGSAPIVIFNIVSLALGGTVLFLKLRAGGRLARLIGVGPRNLQVSR